MYIFESMDKAHNPWTAGTRSTEMPVSDSSHLYAAAGFAAAGP